MKTPPGELDLVLSQVREAALLTDLAGRAVRDRGKGVDLPEHPLPRRLLQNLPHGLAGTRSDTTLSVRTLFGGRKGRTQSLYARQGFLAG